MRLNIVFIVFGFVMAVCAVPMPSESGSKSEGAGNNAATSSTAALASSITAKFVTATASSSEEPKPQTGSNAESSSSADTGMKEMALQFMRKAAAAKKLKLSKTLTIEWGTSVWSGPTATGKFSITFEAPACGNGPCTAKINPPKVKEGKPTGQVFISGSTKPAFSG